MLVFAHELGHIAQHSDLFDRVDGTNAMLQPGAWGNPAASAARYSRNAREEAEANAFAAELLCPAEAVFDLWRRMPAWESEHIAAHLDLPIELVRVQLAEGFRRFVRTGGVTSVDDAQRPQQPREENREQDEAVHAVGHPVLVNAGPGTGKTATLVERIGFLLAPGADGRALATARDILVLTFTNEAADELRQRVAKVHGAEAASRMTLSTFHGFGAQLLQKYGKHVGLGAEPRIMDPPAQEELLLRVLGTAPCPRLLKLQDPRETALAAISHISHLKNGLHSPDSLEAEIAQWTAPDSSEASDSREVALQFLALYRAYEAAKQVEGESGAVDFGDLILLPYQILRDRADAREEVRRTYRWVLVDEYQDVGRSIARLLQEVCGLHNPPWVVGDARQSIHRFRGAAPENVAEFAADFAHLGGVEEVELRINYRSSRGIVTAANQLATLMADPEHTSQEFHRYWREREGAVTRPEPAVCVAEANSDPAEQVHIVGQVQRWLANDEIRPAHIAVLARRNSDVRKIGLQLRAAGVPVAAGGVVTAEGAGGDLGACVGLLDSFRAAVPRFAYALGRLRGADREVVNAAVGHLLTSAEGTRFPLPESPAAELVGEVERVRAALNAIRFNSDAWAVLSAFLFDCSDYLRLQLESRDPEAELALEEIATALSMAAGHRFARSRSDCSESRMLFGEHYRRTLVNPIASVDAERTRRDAVRVMTVHASKGLEFPYVIVAGQTGRGRDEGGDESPEAEGAAAASGNKPAKAGAEPKRPKPRYSWLPDALQPDARAEREQEDALLFVGVTRAQRQAFVSYAATANDRERSQSRRTVLLLGRWMETFYGQEPDAWHLPPSVAPPVNVRHVWGGSHATIKVRRLADGECGIRTYLEDVLGMRFRAVPAPLYPEFFGRVRSAVAAVAGRVRTTGVGLTEDEVLGLFDAAWPADEHEGHPHVELYRPMGQQALLQFAEVYSATGTDWKQLPNSVDGPVSLDLVAYAEDPTGRPVALGFRPESLSGLSKDGSTIPWGSLKGAKRLSFALLAADRPDVQAQVYSGADGRIYDYKINPRYLTGTVEKARERHTGLSTETWTQLVTDRMCERCPVRISCPFWMDLVT
jgi:superfamily I DNA/RNA helicase